MRKSLLGMVMLIPLSSLWLCDRRPHDSPDDGDYVILNAKAQPRPLSPEERRVCLSLASFSVAPLQAFPAALAWGPAREVSQDRADGLEDAIKRAPVAFLEDCLHNYEQQVQGYRLLFVKQEKVNGKMRPKETIRVHFREKPFSVHMHWLKGQEACVRSLYVHGNNDGKLIARGLAFGFEVPILVTRTLDAPDVKATSRFPVTEFGIYKGAKSTIDAMRAAEKRGALAVRYDGIECVKELGDRYCYKLVRGPYDPPEVDGINELTIYVDVETLMQTGSVLKDAEGKLIAEYFFRDIELNPQFDEQQFTNKSL